MPANEKIARKVALQAPLFTLEERVLYYVDPKPPHSARIAVPQHLRKDLLDKAHHVISLGRGSMQVGWDVHGCCEVS